MFQIRSHPTSAAAKHLTTFPDPTVISQGSLGNQSFKYTLHRLNRAVLQPETTCGSSTSFDIGGTSFIAASAWKRNHVMPNSVVLLNT